MYQALKNMITIYKNHLPAIFLFSGCHALFFYLILALFHLCFFSGKEGFSWGTLLIADVSPALFMVVCSFLFVVYFFILWEIAAFLFLFHQCAAGKTVGVRDLLVGGILWVLGSMRWVNIWLVPFVFLVLPLQVVMIWSGFFLQWQIPVFVLQFLQQSPGGLFFANLLAVAVQICGVQSLFLFHYLFIWKNPVLSAFHYSRKMGWQRLLQTSLLLLAWNFLWSVGSFLLYTGFFYIANQILLWLSFSSVAGQICFAVFRGIEQLLLLSQGCLLVPMSIGIVHGCYLLFLQGDGGVVCCNWFSQQKKIVSVTIYGVLLLGCCGYFASIYLHIASGSADFQLGKQPLIVAHRGYTQMAPENTVAAIEAAKKIGVTAIEIDVQMTKDGQIVLFHDGDLRRVLGVKKQVREMNYSELAQMVAVKYSYLPVSQQPFPLLSTALAAGGEQMLWNIEIKEPARKKIAFSWGKEKGEGEICEPEKEKRMMVLRVLDVLQQQGCAERVVLSSLDYRILEQVKQVRPGMPTLYIMAFAGHYLGNLSAADGVSMEITALTPRLSWQVQKREKSLWVWTVNDRQMAAKLLSYPVDGVITDNPPFIRNFLEACRNQPFCCDME